MTQKNIPQSNMMLRPPVVAVLGHIDHGKTTLLDFIRKSSVAAKEAGNITQHIGAYEIAHTLPDGIKKRITFLDTPGHEAFSKMRARGAKVADIAVLVVAADEGVKPQTLEALEHITASGTTLVVALNKIDKPEARTERVKQQLAEKGVLLEGWGGTVPNQEISAKSGKGIPELLGLLLLVADVAELKGDPALPAEGIVIETHKDAKIGNSATLVITNGTLKKNESVFAGNAIGKIKHMVSSDGAAVASATFSSPVVVQGFETLPEVGEQFHAAKDKKSAEAGAAAFHAVKEKAVAPATEVGVVSKKPVLNIVLKADAAGTKEAVENMISGSGIEGVDVRIIKSGVGEVNEGDVVVAESVKGIIAAFKVKTAAPVEKLANVRGVPVLHGETIYELLDAVREKLKDLLPKEIIRTDLGAVSILAVFRMDKTKMIVGGKVSQGKIKKGAKADVKRKGSVIFSGKITQLQHNKEDVPEVQQGRECGMLFMPSSPQDTFISVGDELLAYEEELKQKTL